MTTYSYVIQPGAFPLVLVTTGGASANAVANAAVYDAAWAAQAQGSNALYVPNQLPADILGTPPDPVITGGTSANAAVLAEAYDAAWAPNPALYYFMGANAPYMPNVLPASVPAVPPDPVIKTEYNREQRPWDPWWVPPDPLPQLMGHALQPAIPIGGLGSAQANAGVYASFPADVSTITWLQLDPELISPVTPPSPPPVLPALAQAQRQWDQWWVQPDPLPTLPPKHFQPFVQRVLFVPRAELYAALLSPEIKPTLLTASTFIRPPPYHPAGPPHYESIVAAWAAPDPQPPQLPAQIVTPPFIPARAPDVVDVAATWAPEAPFAQRLARLIQGVAPQATVVAKTNAGIAIGAWTPEAVVPQRRALLVTLPEVVPPSRTAFQVILSAWEPTPAPVQGQLARFAQVPVPEILLAQINSAIAIGAWAPEEVAVQGRKIPPHTAALALTWFPTVVGAQNATVAAWQDVPVQPVLPRLLPIFMTAVVVNNPPLIGVSLDNLAEIIGFWAPSLFDAWFTSPQIVNPGPPKPPAEHHGSLIHEALHSPHELGSTLRAGIGALSRS